jgi:hypothetical protein
MVGASAIAAAGVIHFPFRLHFGCGIQKPATLQVTVQTASPAGHLSTVDKSVAIGR